MEKIPSFWVCKDCNKANTRPDMLHRQDVEYCCTFCGNRGLGAIPSPGFGEHGARELITGSSEFSAVPAISSVTAGATFGHTTTEVGTVHLTTPSEPAGTVVTLVSADTAKLTVPASVTVAGDRLTATFTITGVGAGGPTTITASYLGVDKTCAVTTS
jgi:hypothetical protein